jgi:ribosomal protein S18 acetylase RimI-like enzyme
MSFQIRPAEAVDVSSLVDLLSELGYPLSSADLAGRLSHAASNPNVAVFVAESDGAVCGLIGVQIGEFVHTLRPYGHITGFVVSSEQRSQGIGSKLLDHAEAWLRERGVGDVFVLAAFHRQGAHRFYAARGYQMTGYRFVKTL